MTVREQVALGRLLPLGAAGDPLWITESAVADVLRRAAALPGIRLGAVRILLADPAAPPVAAGREPVRDGVADGVTPARDADGGGAASGGGAFAQEGASAGDGPSVDGGPADRPGPEVVDAAPLGALAHGPLRIEAGFEATMDSPLPVAAALLRDALAARARDALGATVAAVDLRITGILEEPDSGGAEVTPAPGGVDGTAVPAGAGGTQVPDRQAGSGEAAAAVADAVRAVPGVHAVTARLAGAGTGVRVVDPHTGAGGRRVQVQIAVAAGHLPLTVARAVAVAATAAAATDAPGPVSTAVVVTDVH
ncbi:hypothetical protein [Actinacidiphila acidipaludis]|nr:hypothetical protein [Streptomyces acidipaludis]